MNLLVGLPANSAKWWQRGSPLASAPALAVANETARIAFAPIFYLHQPHSFQVPSTSSTIFLSIQVCLVTSNPFKAGERISFTLETALRQPLPRKRFASLSRSSSASYTPVEAPDGTAALKSLPSLVITSASTVGLPRESMISRARTCAIVAKPRFDYC